MGVRLETRKQPTIYIIINLIQNICATLQKHPKLLYSYKCMLLTKCSLGGQKDAGKNAKVGRDFPAKLTRLRCMHFPVCAHHLVNWLQCPSDSPCQQVTHREALLQCHHRLGVADSCLVSWQHKLGSFPSWRKDNCSRTQCLHQRWKEQSIVQHAKISIANI